MGVTKMKKYYRGLNAIISSSSDLLGLKLGAVGGTLFLILLTVPSAAQAVPRGAAELGYTKLLIDEHPVAADISGDRNGHSKWFSGLFYSNKPMGRDDFKTTDDGLLQLGPGASMVSTPKDFSDGALPVLSAAKGFYIEYEVKISDNDNDHWPAVWSEPVEHNLHAQDHYPEDPAGYERWMELDVDEGGFGPGTCSTAINWEGIYPHYTKHQNGNNVSHVPLDRTQWHTYGASYDPKQKKVKWWLDGEEVVSTTTPNVPDIAAKQHYYIIIGNQTHKKRLPYMMFLRAVKAYVPDDSASADSSASLAPTN
jgi:hypothetical protein